MTPETKQALEAFVLQIIDAAKTGATWTAEQTPLLVQEWLKWEYTRSVINIGLAGVVLFVLWALVLIIIPRIVYWDSKASDYGYRRDRADDEAKSSRWIGSLIAGIITLLILLLPVADELKYVYKLHTAPRVVVFEKFIELVK